MDCHRLFYKPIQSAGPYDRYIVKQKQREITQKKQLFYSEILKFTSSRYPKQFLIELQKQINPFQHSLQTLRNIILSKYPDLPQDVVNQSVQYVFGKKSREATMIRESQTIIQDGDQFIRNGRKLIKEDFTFDYSRFFNDSLPLPDSARGRTPSPQNPKSQRGSFTKRSNTSRYQNPQSWRKKLQTDRQRQQTDRGPESSQRKNMMSMSKNQLFNQIIAEQIKKQSKRFKTINVIYENDPDDILVKQQFTKRPGFTDRSAKLSESLNFKERDVIVPIQGGIETGRSQMQQLNNLLSQVTLKCQEKGGVTQRSDRGMFMMKISKKNMENLYNMQGSLKMDTIKRAANRMIYQYS